MFGCMCRNNASVHCVLRCASPDPARHVPCIMPSTAIRTTPARPPAARVKFDAWHPSRKFAVASHGNCFRPHHFGPTQNTSLHAQPSHNTSAHVMGIFNSLDDADSLAGPWQPAASQGRWGLEWRSPHDRDIVAYAFPAFFATVLEPIQAMIDTGMPN